MRWIRRTTFLLGAALAGISMTREGVARDRPATGTPAPFSIVVTVESTGITADCEEGCAWKRVSAESPGLAFRITDRGIRPSRPAETATASFQSDAFAIVVRPEKPAVRAACLTGCTWKELQASHPRSAYRITHEGVEAAL